MQVLWNIFYATAHTLLKVRYSRNAFIYLNLPLNLSLGLRGLCRSFYEGGFSGCLRFQSWQADQSVEGL